MSGFYHPLFIENNILIWHQLEIHNSFRYAPAVDIIGNA